MPLVPVSYCSVTCSLHVASSYRAKILVQKKSNEWKLGNVADLELQNYMYMLYLVYVYPALFFF